MFRSLPSRPARGLAVAGAFLLAGPLLAAGSAPALALTHGQDGDRFEYALHDPDTDAGSTFSTSNRSWRDVARRFDGERDPVLWFALDGRSYLVRDPATVARARTILAPVRELGKKQGKLGAKQGALGGEQGRLGAEQGRIGARQGELAARLSRLAVRAARSDGESASMRAERREIEAQMRELGRRQEELGRRQEPLGERQRALGEQQAELGRQQAKASRRASAALMSLAERARADGRARRVD